MEKSADHDGGFVFWSVVGGQTKSDSANEMKSAGRRWSGFLQNSVDFFQEVIWKKIREDLFQSRRGSRRTERGMVVSTVRAQGLVLHR
jgi:hypothetical protein